ncbi:MOSC domain-containing protein [Stappia stellulata]|uniref:MOSC domain-containing protein n=1 Tax=Stappia stellulata TaxID=71235 RepID=UPI001CD4E4AF|nr:MOSC domain-containing protein [Stappia stellulata]MCA1243746.1 MOSC domain-containing protein [Stappia stellulata]|eukprot:jgi/Tetstr1/465439/TSEL_010123.t1
MTADLFGRETADDLEIVPARKVTGLVSKVYATPDADDFQTRWTAALKLGFEGIAGDRHAGFTRKSGGREPWYPRGTEMCNERQISIVSLEELAAIAKAMDIQRVDAGWIGANVLTEGLPRLTLLPPRTRMVFAGGVVLRVDGDNSPCRIAGGAIAAHYPEREGLDLSFARLARRQRGLVAYVERPGVIRPGEEVVAHVPEHWLYR